MKFVVHVCVAIFVLTGCAMRMSRTSYQITERSKREVPAWVSLEPNQFHKEGDRYSFVTIKEHVLDLPLGIRQTEEAAYSGYETALHALMRAELLDNPSRAPLSAASRQDLDQRIMEVVRRSHRDIARIEDIYYERNAAADVSEAVSGGSYKIFALLRFPTERLGPLYKELSASLRRSPHGEVAALPVHGTSRKK